MSAAVSLRENFDANALPRRARASREAGQSRRLLALAAIYDGGSRTDFQTAINIGSSELLVLTPWTAVSKVVAHW